MFAGFYYDIACCANHYSIACYGLFFYIYFQVLDMTPFISHARNKANNKNKDYQENYTSNCKILFKPVS